MTLSILLILFIFIMSLFGVWFWYFKFASASSLPTYSKGINALEKGDYNEAINFFSKAIETQTNVKESLYNLGSIYLEVEDLPNATESFEKLLKTTPKDVKALCGYGHALKAQNLNEQAKEAYGKALNENNQHGESYYGLGDIYFKEKNYDSALEHLEKALELCPEKTEIPFLIAKCKDKMCNYNTVEEGQTVISEYLKREGDEHLPPTFDVDLASSYAKTGMIEQTVNRCKKAMAKDDKNVESYKLLGLAQLMKGEKAEAKNSIATALSLDPNNDELHDILSYILCQHEDAEVVRKCRLEYQELVKKKKSKV